MAGKRRQFARVRKAAGYTQESLAEHLRVDRSTVGRWEIGEVEPQAGQRPSIAEALGISLDRLAELLAATEIDSPADGVAPAPLNEWGLPVEALDLGWEEFMRWLSRRWLLTHGVAATAAPMLGLRTNASPRTPILATLPATSWASPIYQAVLNPMAAVRDAASSPETEAGGQPLGLSKLRRAASRAMQASLSSDYAQLTKTLPALIGRTELVSLQEHATDPLPVHGLLSDVYAIAGWTMIKADSPAVAWIAAQRALQLAEQAEDVLRSAAATRCLAEVHMRAKSFDDASRTALLAATYLDAARTTDQAPILCLRGASLLSAAAAAARRGDSREAYTALRAAAVAADALGEDRSDLGTVFGPTNVAIHQVAVAIELGNAGEAVKHIHTVDLSRMPRQLTERRARFLIDVARSHMQLQNDTAALGALLQAEEIAPDELRNHRLTHEVLQDLLTRERRSSGVRALASRCQLLN